MRIGMMASARSSGLDAEERAASAHDTARRYASAMQLPRNTIVLLMCRFRWTAQSRVESFSPRHAPPGRMTKRLSRPVSAPLPNRGQFGRVSTIVSIFFDPGA